MNCVHCSVSNMRRVALLCTHHSAVGSGEVIFHEGPVAKVVTLNRPAALNALNRTMVQEMYPQYYAWHKSQKPLFVLLKGAGEKAFCAGGDVVAIATQKEVQREFFFEEYFLDYLIAKLEVPHVSVMQGIVMGGGVGLAINGSHRIATDNSLFAMPETAIGLFPDVGGTWALPRLAGGPALGMFLGLTGARLKGYDLKAAGIATHFVPQAKLPQLVKQLEDISEQECVFAGGVRSAVDKLIAQNEQPTGSYSLAEHLPVIERCFSRDSVEEILEALEKENTPWAKGLATNIRSFSPTSVKVTFEQLRRGAKLTDVAQAYTMEYNITQYITRRGKDLFEGVKAKLIEKTNNPKWDPPTLAAVKHEEVLAHFEPLPGVKVWEPPRLN
eukprot:TRINITY_DN6296_c0_g1_i1.p1 TRINITY_DN6296_c0_g1~~TRINITY_DN6296_c0_g1_i1.p1  ORF type:complete len:385 (-),score=85.78 TRINITY_DN6296_c0_g1_i1:6-1160(-)